MTTTNRQYGLKRSRGIAMLLVLISLATATILATAYLASRDNSSAIGTNVAAAAAARWAAVSGIEMGVAVMETDTDWRSNHVAGKLLDDYPLAGAEFDLDVMDIATGAPPTATTEYMELTSTAVVDGVEQVATAIAYASATEPDAVDIDLSEFAVFVNEDLRLRDNAIIARWPVAPLSQLGKRLYIGTREVNASEVEIEPGAAIIDGTLVHVSTAAGGLVSNSSSLIVPKVPLLDTIPMPAPPAPDTPAVGASLPIVMAGGTRTVNADYRCLLGLMNAGAEMTISGNHALIVDNTFQIQSGSKIIIDGNVKMLIGTTLTMNGGSIEVLPGGTLTMYLRNFAGNDAYIGDDRPDNTRDNTGAASVIAPNRIRIFGYGSGSWSMVGNTVVKASMYGPNAAVTIEDTSALYGRVAANAVELRDDAAIFYNPELNARRGYSDPGSYIFDGGSNIKNEFLTLATLETTDLQAASDSSNAIVLPPRSSGRITPSGYSDPAPDLGTAGSPSPRTNPVEYTISSFGLNMEQFE